MLNISLDFKSKVQIPRGLPAGMLKFGIDLCITLSKAFFGLSFLRPVTMVKCTMYQMYHVHFISLWAYICKSLQKAYTD